MKKKEISEISRRFKPEKTNISRIYGCYVNNNREIISLLDESLALMPQEEAQQFLTLLKKTLSGAPGRSLTDIVFATEQVVDSEEHRLLMALREDNAEARQAFYQKVIDVLDMEEGNYLILCANETYDVPSRGHGDNDRNDREAGVSGDTVYRYFICAICPVKDGKLELGYDFAEKGFHNRLAKQIVGAPELGFLFPAFDDRTANIYNALFYHRKPEELHEDFVESIFHTQQGMSAMEQREAFEMLLTDSVDCSMDVIRSVNEQLKAKIDEHAESRDDEPLTVSERELSAILKDSGVSAQQMDAFQVGFSQSFGNAALDPENLIDAKHFEIKAGEVTITVSPENSFLVQTRQIEGRKYIVIPADGGAELNGLSVTI